jgi:hypothetical protein
VNKPKAQGTAWESAFVRQAQGAGLLSDRLPESGSWDCGDVWIGDTPSRFNRGNAYRDVAVVAWSRLVSNGSSRRVPDGARSVVVIDTDDFMRIADAAIQAGVSFVVECKATERLNVTRALDQARRKLAKWKER